MKAIARKWNALVSSVKYEYKTEPTDTLFKKVQKWTLATFMLLLCVTLLGFAVGAIAGIVVGIGGLGVEQVFNITIPHLQTVAKTLVLTGFYSLGAALGLCGIFMAVGLACLPVVFWKNPDMFVHR